MSGKLRILSKLIGGAVALGLMVLVSGSSARAESFSIPYLYATGSPAGYNDVTDTINFAVEFDDVHYGGGYSGELFAVVSYYSGANGTGAVLGSSQVGIYAIPNTNVGPGNHTNSYTTTSNTPALLRASEPAGTQSIVYQYVVYAGGGYGIQYGTVNVSANRAGPIFTVHG